MNVQGIHRAVTAAAVLSMLAACGGGGGSGDSPSTSQAQSIAITPTNASPVAAEAVDAGGAGGGAGAVTGVQVSAPTPGVSAMAALANKVRQSVQAPATDGVVGVTTSTTNQCSTSGTVTTTVNRANANSASAGDRIDLSFNNCVDSVGTVNGGLSITLVSFNSDLSLLVADGTASNFSVAVGTLTERLNGSLRVSVDDTSSTHSLLGITSSSMGFERLRNGTLRATRTLSNYTYQEDLTTATGSTSQTFSFSVSGTFPALGTVAFTAQTTQPIITAGGASFPSSGAGKVTGANGSSVVVTVVSNGVQLDVDANGDGTIDSTITRTWAEFNGDL